ncbi:MAG: MFS transporter [Bryobacterales bacterium]|nr:MFS transporter [Bryobacteraceae bacterium]MDW8130814.1 MFS transporter [Bryobacterales bacterium]
MAEAVAPLSGPSPPPAGERAWPDLFRALRHRNFRLFLCGQLVSLVGTWMQSAAQSWLMYRLTHSEWLLGATWFCSQIPVFLLGPLGGVAADRFSRHRIVLLTQAAAMCQAFVLAALTLSAWVQPWHILTLATVLGVIYAFDMPGRQALLIHLAAKDDLLNAIALNSAAFNVARLLGPALAGVLVARYGEGVCFVVNGASFVAVLASLAAMRLPAPAARPRESPLEHLKDGFRYAYRSAPVRTLLGLIGAASIAGMPAIVLMPFFADEIFGRGSQGMGFLLGSMGLGAVVGTLWLAGKGRTSQLPRVILASSLMLGVALVLFAISPSYYLALALMPVVGFSVMRQNASANTLIQTLIPDCYRGRVMALYAMMVVGLGPFGSLLAGALAHRIGARGAVLLGGLLCLGAAFWFQMRRRVFRAVAVAVGMAALAASPLPALNADAPAVREIVRELESISGLRQRRPIRLQTIEREHVKAFLEERMRTELRPEEIRAEEILLKKLGFLPPEFDLRRTMLELLSEQASAFYDYRSKRLYLIEGAGGELQHSALVHEVAHALADQSFDLGRFIRRARQSDDAALARMAVMEGQATWLMSEYLTRRTGQSLGDSPVLVRMMSRAAELSAGQFPVYESVPLYLRETLIFPYSRGMVFQHAIIEKFGSAAFARVFVRPPESTRHVLHPETYLSGERPETPKLPRLRLPRGYRLLIEGTLGELDHLLLLKQYGSAAEAEQVASGWRGGYYCVWEQKRGGRTLLVHASCWATPEAARRWYDAYQRVLRGKWKRFIPTAQGPAQVCGEGDDGHFLVRVDGRAFLAAEGWPSEQALFGSLESLRP